MGFRVISRQEALARGDRFYFTGKPCPRGHVCQRYTCSWACELCTRKPQLTKAQKLRRKLRAREYNQKNAARLSAQKSARWHSDPGLRRRRRLYCSRWYRRNRAAQLQYRHRYYREHIEWFKEYARRSDVRAKVIARVLQWQRENKAKANAKSLRWKRANPAKILAAQRLRRAGKLGANGHYSAEQLRDLLERQKFRCANPHCRADLKRHRRQLDHRRPLSRGGSNWIRNLQWLCTPCNRKKRDQIWQKFLRGYVYG